MSNTNVTDYNNIVPIEKLYHIAKEQAQSYRTATPYAHGIFDNVFNPEILHHILQEAAELRATESWKEFDTKYEKKLQLNKDQALGPYTKAFIHNLNASPFLTFLEKLTGISGLIPDPYLAGGGLHRIETGGKLGIHVDFNKDPFLGVYRRINVLVYLNENWQESYGGHFELWSDTLGTEKKKILPIFNRMAIFSTTQNSFHGHPHPLTCPPERARQSVALYYYTVDKGEQSAAEHSTVFIDKKGKREELGTPNLGRKIKNKISRFSPKKS